MNADEVKSLACSEKCLTLCRELSMPEEVVIILSDIYDNLNYTPIIGAFNGLFSADTGEDAAAEIKEFFKEKQDGLPVLAVNLAASLFSREEYKKRGIGNDIFIDTMKIFTRFVGEHLKSFGKYGFNREWWTYRNLSLSLFRLGELEFEMCSLSEDMNELIKEDTPVISVHIPSDAALTRDRINSSYLSAERFFLKYYNDYDYKLVCCDSWLLSPVLKKLLPSESKILGFSGDYEIVKYNPSDKSFMEWVYKREYDDYGKLTENTSLERNIKKHLLNGGAIGSAFGILAKNFGSESI